MAINRVKYREIAFAWYSVRSFRVLTATKSAGPVRFKSRARTPRVIGIYLLGYSATSILTGISAALIGLALIALFAIGAGAEINFDAAADFAAPTVAVQLMAVAAYFLIFILWGAFRHIFVTQPLFRHYIETLEIVGSESLHNIVQRDRDEHREAEGFAEALDLGAAI